MDPLSSKGFGHGVEVGSPVGLPAATHVQRAIKVEVDHEIRCQGEVDIRTRPGERKTCNKLLIEMAARPWQVRCPRCGAVNRSSDPGRGPGA